MLRVLAILLCFIPANMLRAETVYSVGIGHWTVSAASQECQAINRPESEIAFQAINTMLVRAKPGRRDAIQLGIALWPGAVTEADTLIHAKLDGGGEFDLPAKSVTKPWAVIGTTGPLPDDLVAAFSGTGSHPLYRMTVETNASKAKTVMNIEDLPRVMASLTRCLELLGK